MFVPRWTRSTLTVTAVARSQAYPYNTEQIIVFNVSHPVPLIHCHFLTSQDTETGTSTTSNTSESPSLASTEAAVLRLASQATSSSSLEENLTTTN